MKAKAKIIGSKSENYHLIKKNCSLNNRKEQYHKFNGRRKSRAICILSPKETLDLNPQLQQEKYDDVCNWYDGYIQEEPTDYEINQNRRRHLLRNVK